ncbi:toll/interleukin-1 receptor domain-containing protein [Streptomyces sp. BPSDS2]|uniref:toll/interleukin-1 receptor domain-containing protein n=1 Tax=Streptomyces sp. BPSDS2 TaxID=2571021 RepID=UPI0010C03354|nr:toll/interleukin-1 receptor domain-containing protein [Streptomyces sp. BPSDS2]
MSSIRSGFSVVTSRSGLRCCLARVGTAALAWSRRARFGGIVARRALPRTSAELVEAYELGHRNFREIKMGDADFSDLDLQGASFLGASLRGANFSHSNLLYSQFKAADLSGADFTCASVAASDLIGASFIEATFARADLTGSALNRADLTRANLKRVNLGNARLTDAVIRGANCDGAYLSSTGLSGVDVGALIHAKSLRHSGPSIIDPRTVMQSYGDPGLKAFMLECGVPPIFAEYMIDCARALGGSVIRSLMQSTFISYGGPDESFAAKLYDALKANGVIVFFFPESATLGERIDGEVYRRLHEHDRVILICSEASLNRPGVLHEIQETFDRESRDGGATYLLPIMLDDYVFSGWKDVHPTLAARIGRRVVGDFRDAVVSEAAFDSSMDRLLDALKNVRPVV